MKYPAINFNSVVSANAQGDLSKRWNGMIEVLRFESFPNLSLSRDHCRPIEYANVSKSFKFHSIIS